MITIIIICKNYVKNSIFVKPCTIKKIHGYQKHKIDVYRFIKGFYNLVNSYHVWNGEAFQFNYEIKNFYKGNPVVNILPHLILLLESLKTEIWNRGRIHRRRSLTSGKLLMITTIRPMDLLLCLIFRILFWIETNTS